MKVMPPRFTKNNKNAEATECGPLPITIIPPNFGIHTMKVKSIIQSSRFTSNEVDAYVSLSITTIFTDTESTKDNPERYGRNDPRKSHLVVKIMIFINAENLRDEISATKKPRRDTQSFYQRKESDTLSTWLISNKERKQGNI